MQVFIARVAPCKGGWPPPEKILDGRPNPISRIFFLFFLNPSQKQNPSIIFYVHPKPNPPSTHHSRYTIILHAQIFRRCRVVFLTM